MTEEEIEKEIEHCEMMEMSHREVGNAKSAERFNNKRHKWEKLLEKLNPKMEEELRTYKVGYNNLELEKEKLIKYIEDKIKDCKNTLELLDGTNSHRISILQVQIKDYEDLLERVKSGKYE